MIVILFYLWLLHSWLPWPILVGIPGWAVAVVGLLEGLWRDSEGNT
jgi:hypothetical protein